MGVPDEWPSRSPGLDPGSRQNPAYRPAGKLLFLLIRPDGAAMRPVGLPLGRFTPVRARAPAQEIHLHHATKGGARALCRCAIVAPAGNQGCACALMS